MQHHLRSIASALLPPKVAQRRANRQRIIDDLTRRISTGDDLLVLAFSAPFHHLAADRTSRFRTADGRFVDLAAVQVARSMWNRHRQTRHIAYGYARSKAQLPC